jgi:hypothetical protein
VPLQFYHIYGLDMILTRQTGNHRCIAESRVKVDIGEDMVAVAKEELRSVDFLAEDSLTLSPPVVALALTVEAEV